MKSTFDLKHQIGKITPENPDDLYLLHDIIKPGVLVSSKTTRSIEVERGDRKEKVGRKTVTLTILVEKTELSDKLRLTGKIVDGPEGIEHAHHSLNIKPGTFLTIKKPWKSWEVSKIKAAKKTQEPIIVCILDEREADIYLLRERSKHLISIRGGSLGKREGKSEKGEYFKKVVAALKNREEKYIIIAGPGFAREEIKKLIDKEKIENIFYDSVSHTGKPGLNELFRRDVLEKVVKSNRISEETKIVEKLLQEMLKQGKVVYGLEETKNAINLGAVELLLISDSKVREFEDLIEQAEKTKSNYMIISSKHESGEKFLHLGGIAGFLRFNVS